MNNKDKLIYANELWQKTFICDEVAEVRKFIEQAHAIDAVEVVHGRWIKNEEMRRCDGHIYDYCCSACGGFAVKGRYNNYDVKTPYCPNCGAKMDGENYDV